MVRPLTPPPLPPLEPLPQLPLAPSPAPRLRLIGGQGTGESSIFITSAALVLPPAPLPLLALPLRAHLRLMAAAVVMAAASGTPDASNLRGSKSSACGNSGVRHGWQHDVQTWGVLTQIFANALFAAPRREGLF